MKGTIMKNTIEILACLGVAGIIISCGGRGMQGSPFEGERSVEELLEEMRTDTALIRTLDSLAAVNIGEGARCLDAVKHTFSWDGRLWVYNQDWGGVLEIPLDYIPSDDVVQTELTYHGSTIFSPDSTVVVTVYAGFQPVGSEKYLSLVRTQYDSSEVVKLVSCEESEISFGNGSTSPVIALETITGDGIKRKERYIYSGPGPERVEYRIAVKYPDGMEDAVGNVLDMVDRYPFSPDGSDPEEFPD